MNLFDNLPQRIFSVTEKATRDKLAKAVQTNPELLAKFEQAYREQALGAEKSPHDYHDYVVYKAHEETLNRRYAENRDKVLDAVKNLLPNCRLTGQWSVDIMQNGDDFYLIDMAKADESALNNVVPKELLKHTPDPFLEQLPAVFRKSIDA